METCKAKTIELLREIKTVCEEEQIRYFISGELALFESRREQPKEEFNNGTVAVFAEDVERLSDILTKRQDRKVESLCNNSSFPGFYIRYMDTGTTLINFAETAFAYETNSLGVNIEIICGRLRNTVKRKILAMLKEVWVRENRAYYIGRKSTKGGILRYMAALFLKAAKNTSLMKKLFNAWVREGKVKTDFCEIATPSGFMIKYSDDIFCKAAETTQLEDAFDIVGDIETFTGKYFSRSHKIKPTGFDIWDSEVPWDDFSEIIRKNKLPLTKYRKQEQRFLTWRAAKYFPMRNIRRKYYNYMFCSEDRMLMYREFDDNKKQQVMSLYELGDYEKLGGCLEEYIEIIKKYARYRIGFCSDPDIFEAALCVMLHNEFDNSKKAEELRKKADKIYKIVQYTDYRHFDSVANVFWGERENAEILKTKKAQLLDRIKQQVEMYYEQY